MKLLGRLREKDRQRTDKDAKMRIKENTDKTG